MSDVREDHGRMFVRSVLASGRPMPIVSRSWRAATAVTLATAVATAC